MEKKTNEMLKNFMFHEETEVTTEICNSPQHYFGKTCVKRTREISGQKTVFQFFCFDFKVIPQKSKLLFNFVKLSLNVLYQALVRK